MVEFHLEWCKEILHSSKQSRLNILPNFCDGLFLLQITLIQDFWAVFTHTLDGHLYILP